MRLARYFFLGVSTALILACGGGGAGENLLLGANYGVPNTIGTVVSSVGNTATVTVGGVDFQAKLPAGAVVAPGSSVTLITDGALFADRAYLPAGTHTVTLTDLGTSVGGPIAGFGLIQDGTTILTNGNLAIPPGRWRLDFDGTMRFFAQSAASGMDVHQFRFEFDVFPNGFTNLPVELYGDMPKNGKSQSGLNLTGKIPPNTGVGLTYLDLKGVGQNLKTNQTLKQQNAETWTWVSNDTISTPTGGWESIGIRVNF